ncbi:SWI SNF [Glugoides intestinalis]
MNERFEKLNTTLDEIALQKRLAIEAEHLKRITCTKFIRFFGSFSGPDFKINTRILSDIGTEDKTSFWELVKRVCVTLNTDFEVGECTQGVNIQECQNVFEWTKESGTDGFVLPLTGECKKIQILVKLANQRNVYRLSQPLAAFLNKQTDTRNSIVTSIYKYVNSKRLNDYLTSNVTCDESLENIFGTKAFNFNNIYTLLEPHLQPIFYCVIDVPINEDNIWDVEVVHDDLGQMPVLYHSPKLQQLEKKIEDIKGLKRKVAERIDILETFKKDPSEFISRKIAFESDGVGARSIFYDDLTVQSALYELIKKKE